MALTLASFAGPNPTPSLENFAPARGTDLRIHDPNIIKVGNTYYSYSVGEHLVIHQAPGLDGPWKQTDCVLDKDSIIPKGDRKAPWAPTTIEVKGTFYCYYAVSQAGCRDSAIGVATSTSPGPGSWIDRGAIIHSGTGIGSDIYPMDVSNAIDPSVFITTDGRGYLTFGSYWSGIWQIPLSKDLVSIDNGSLAEAHHLAYEPQVILPVRQIQENPLCGDPSGGHPVEGGYNIRVGRSVSPRGPFVDKQGRDLVDGGGEIVYGSNRDVYAPGGQGVLTDGEVDILYYHYLNKTVGYEFWNYGLGDG
ncbi:hypothetical protein EYZ11_005127 [Aspergillus tanneri]|uniref:arabinan endo-1,5-alpha-L-arabinosidase n=1 Tax=Aspergillus tanneri TaxID=1220188 RepID=A0A4S3JIX2_9EURO|nr:hypothetical protein EYZ11_005127 [Aspergillus tanneri]